MKNLMFQQESEREPNLKVLKLCYVKSETFCNRRSFSNNLLCNSLEGSSKESVLFNSD